MLQKEWVQNLLFWIIFILLWSAHDLVFHPNFWDLVVSNIHTMWVYAPLVYLNIYFLVPQFLLKQKKPPVYILTLGAGLLLTTLFSTWNVTFYFSTRDPETAEFFTTPLGQITLLTELLVLLGFSMTLFLLREWYQKERYTQAIEQKRLEMELHLLKSQVNPHFLFNSLNSIYLMSERDVKASQQMLLQFSDILSHQLYETNKERITLAKEIDNLTNYIRIEEVRHHDLAKVQFDCLGMINGQQIAPMLLMPLVENAFKHGQSSEGYWINIHLELKTSAELFFTVENSFRPRQRAASGGIGLNNVRRRLELIYPNQHELIVHEESNVFRVFLNLKLQEHAVHHS